MRSRKVDGIGTGTQLHSLDMKVMLLGERCDSLEKTNNDLRRELHDAGLAWYHCIKPKANPLQTQTTLNLLLKHLGLKVVHVDEDRIVPIDETELPDIPLVAKSMSEIE